MSWRVFLWMSSPWLALWPGLWLWLPDEPYLVTIALRTLLIAAPFCLLQPRKRIEFRTLLAAWSMACAGLCGAYLMEERRGDLLPTALLLGVWVLALRGMRIESAVEVARTRISALVILFAPLLWDVFVLRSEIALAAATPWNWSNAPTSISSAWPALVLCAALALRSMRGPQSFAAEPSS